MRTLYFIDIAPNDQMIVFCPPDILREHQIKRIAFGSKSIAVDFFPHPDQQDRLVISKKIQQEIQFPKIDIQLHTFINKETLYIGPLVGIFTAGFTSIPQQPIGERTLLFSKLLSVNKMVGALAFVFGEQHIDWQQGTIGGYFFQNQTWETVEIPFPNVIYDRLPNRKSEMNPKLQRVKERLQKEYLIPWYNPGFFNKLDIYYRLQRDPSVTNYLPETHSFTSYTIMETMLDKYGHVFIKPKNGSLGLGVHQVIYDKQTSNYYCRYQDNKNHNRLQKYRNLQGLLQSVFAEKTLDKMIIQQGISLLRYEQRQIDFRVHTNKDDQGKWQVSAIAAKIAGQGSVTTHARSGGDIKTISEVFPQEVSDQHTQKLKNVALLLSHTLDRNIDGIIGEIGFDFGIDRNGDVWLFEANSKPGRSIFSHPELKEVDLLTRKLSLAFAVFLTEKSLFHPEELFK